LAATDFSDQATLALKMAARLAKQFHSRLHVLYVSSPQAYAPGAGVLVPALQQVDMALARKQLHDYVAKIPQVRTTKHEEIVSCGLAAETIYETAETKGIDLAVVGSHGRGGLGKLLLGSVAEAAVRRLHCPVLVVGPHCSERYRTLKSMILVADLFAGSSRAAEYAVFLARESGTTLTVIHVVPACDEESGWSKINNGQSMSKKLRQLIPHDAGLEGRVHFEVLIGVPEEQILRIAIHKNAGLIVMDAREQSTLADHAPWATLSQVIRRSHCPVLAVQPHIV
jgi:nucleotide-binding universal stress UspA family protein